jgi:hypothetical protein
MEAVAMVVLIGMMVIMDKLIQAEGVVAPLLVMVRTTPLEISLEQLVAMVALELSSSDTKSERPR